MWRCHHDPFHRGGSAGLGTLGGVVALDPFAQGLFDNVRKRSIVVVGASFAIRKTSGSMVTLTDFLGVSAFRPMVGADSTIAADIVHQSLNLTLDDTMLHDIIVVVNRGLDCIAALAMRSARF